MKRVLCVLIVAVLLFATTWNSVSARQNPLGWKPIERDNGDDHPWGGEQNISTDPTPIRVAEGPSYSVTGLVQLDTFLMRLFTRYWLQELPTKGETTITSGGTTTYHTTTGGATGTGIGSGNNSAN